MFRNDSLFIPYWDNIDATIAFHITTHIFLQRNDLLGRKWHTIAMYILENPDYTQMHITHHLSEHYNGNNLYLIPHDVAEIVGKIHKRLLIAP